MEQKDFKMSKEQIEKQAIEEMANDLENHTCMSQFQAAIASRMLYAKGYRKQREGEWVDFGKTFYCSVCKKTDWYKSSYCPNCGAKMKGGAE